MRYLILIVFSLWSLEAFSNCGNTGINVWPSGFTVKKNSIIVLNAYGDSQTILHELNKKHPIYLKSGDKKVPLIVKELLVGDFYITQVVLAHEDELVDGEIYQLHIDNLPEYEKLFKRWNPIYREYEFTQWKVEDDTDTTPPVWKDIPKETKKTFTNYGNGVSKYINFSFLAHDQSEILIKTTISNPKTKKSVSYFIEPSDSSSLKIGHDMCFGPFLLNDNSPFEVSFDIMDASGNTTIWNREKMILTRPTKENSSSEE